MSEAGVLDKWEAWCRRRTEWQKWSLMPVALFLIPIVAVLAVVLTPIFILKYHIFDGGYE